MIQAQKQGLVRVMELLATTPDSPLHAAIHATEELGKYPTLFKAMHEHGRAPRIVWPEARHVPHWEADKYAMEVGPGSSDGGMDYWDWRYELNEEAMLELGFKLIKCTSCGEYREYPCSTD